MKTRNEKFWLKVFDINCGKNFIHKGLQVPVKMYSPDVGNKNIKKRPTDEESNIDSKINNFSSISTHPISAAALRRGKLMVSCDRFLQTLILN